MLERSTEQLPGRHQSFIEEKIPDWLTRASSDKRLALKRTGVAIPEWYRTASAASHVALAQAVKASWISQAKVDRLIGPLANVRQFAEPLLRQALKERFGVEVDVANTYVRLYLPKGILVGFNVATVSLLDAALRNFEAKEKVRGYFDGASCFVSEPDGFGQFDVLAINKQMSVREFVSTCRELDIGGQYTRQLEQLLLPRESVNKAALEYTVKTSQRDAFRAAVLLAGMKGDIGPDSQASLLHLLGSGATPRPHGRILYCHQLQMMEAKLTGIMLLAGDLERSCGVEPLLVYIPDDPQHPVKEYPSAAAFRLELARRLCSTDYQRFFARFIAQEHRGYFFAALNNPSTVVSWGATRVKGDLWREMYYAKLDKILNDARVIAVPTADEDRKSRRATWDSLEKIASTFLQVAALVAMPFVPFLGELMLAYTAYQLLDETFTGILDWSQGHVIEAADHLLSIAESLAELGAFAVGGAVAGKMLALKPSTFIDGLKPVVLEDGRTRLWNPDLKPYERNALLPTGSVPDELGLHRHAGAKLLPLDGNLYEVGLADDEGAGHIRHPQRADAYRPLIKHNGAGAWAHEVERPMEWQGAQLFRRLGHSVAEFSDATAERILAVSGIDDAVLRDLHVHNRRPPALLEDTIRRFKLDQQIEAFIAQMRSTDPRVYLKADPQMQEQLLKAQDVGVQKSRMRSGDLIRSVAETVEDSRLRALLGESPAIGDSLPGIDARAARLRLRVAGWAQEHRALLFAAKEDAFEVSSDEPIRQMRRVFPDLPKTIAEELWRNATSTDRLHMRRNPGITRQMAHEVLFYLREVRLSRACEGLYLEAIANPDTDRLALHLLETLNGWSPEVRIEVREGHFSGALLDSIGHPERLIRKVLVRQQGRYQAYDDFGMELHELDDLYGAIQHALPDTQRQALGLPHVGQGAELRLAVRRQTLLPRSQIRALLDQPPVGPGIRSPMGLAVGRSGYLLGGGDFLPQTSLSVEQRLQALYPELSDEDMAALRSERLIGDPGMAVARLEDEYIGLVNDLEAWVKEVPSHHPLTGVLLDAETLAQQHLNRQAFMAQLKASWSRQRTAASPYEPYHFYLNLDIMGQLPELSADFGHVTELELTCRTQDLKGHGFLKSFAKLQFLTLESIHLDSFPLEIFQMRDLVSLTLNDCALRLTEATAEGLSRIEGLKLLSLSDNPLGVTPYMGFMKGLRDLYLRNAGLTEVPSGLFDLEYLSRADLTSNEIVEVSESINDVPDAQSVVFDFRGNPLSLESVRRISDYVDNAGFDRQVQIVLDGASEDEESSSDTDEVSTDSALGSDDESDNE